MWQARIAHVPQHIYLSDASIAENIAFGVSYKNIDFERVRLAASKAQISSVIDGMSDGYGTRVGERGIKLSGGQRQRIGIARAMYKNADVIIFDEATSALDDETECQVIQSLDTHFEKITTFMIAHRLSSLKNCDVIIELKNGQIINHMTYQSLMGVK